jgi:hypothetical protein
VYAIIRMRMQMYQKTPTYANNPRP